MVVVVGRGVDISKRKRSGQKGERGVHSSLKKLKFRGKFAICKGISEDMVGNGLGEDLLESRSAETCNFG